MTMTSSERNRLSIVGEALAGTGSFIAGGFGFEVSWIVETSKSIYVNGVNLGEAMFNEVNTSRMKLESMALVGAGAGLWMHALRRFANDETANETSSPLPTDAQRL